MWIASYITRQGHCKKADSTWPTTFDWKDLIRIDWFRRWPTFFLFLLFDPWITLSVRLQSIFVDLHIFSQFKNHFQIVKDVLMGLRAGIDWPLSVGDRIGRQGDQVDSLREGKNFCGPHFPNSLPFSPLSPAHYGHFVFYEPIRI